jgi:tRNA(Phe) wybutosine-synthesizing methylase Tyw3
MSKFLVNARVEVSTDVEIGGKLTFLHSVEYLDFEVKAFNGEEALERVSEMIEEDSDASVNDFDLHLIGET